MRPTLAFNALDANVSFVVGNVAHVTNTQAVAINTLGVVVFPFGVFHFSCRLTATLETLDAPLTLPISFGNLSQRRLETIDVVAYVTVIAQN
jgi:hypothetical protein